MIRTLKFGKTSCVFVRVLAPKGQAVVVDDDGEVDDDAASVVVECDTDAHVADVDDVCAIGVGGDDDDAVNGAGAGDADGGG